MKLGYTIIYVEDVVKTVQFYEKAFSLKLKFLHESKQYAEMETGNTTLSFAAEKILAMQFKPNRPSEVPAGFEIALVTDDVQKAFDIAIKNGAKQVALPTKKPWGQIVGYVSDINGVLVEICTPISE